MSWSFHERFFLPSCGLLTIIKSSHIFHAVKPGLPSTINMDMSLAWEKNLTPGEVIDDALLEVRRYSVVLGSVCLTQGICALGSRFEYSGKRPLSYMFASSIGMQIFMKKWHILCCGKKLPNPVLWNDNFWSAKFIFSHRTQNLPFFPCKYICTYSNMETYMCRLFQNFLTSGTPFVSPWEHTLLRADLNIWVLKHHRIHHNFFQSIQSTSATIFFHTSNFSHAVPITQLSHLINWRKICKIPV